MCASLLAIFGCMVTMLFIDPMQARLLAPLAIGGILLLIFGYFAGGYVRRRFKSRVLERGGQVCPNCHYLLPGGEEGGETRFCPECREPYKPEELRRIWEG